MSNLRLALVGPGEAGCVPAEDRLALRDRRAGNKGPGML